MASKSADIRPGITLACTECKERNYITTKNRRNTPDRLELKTIRRVTAVLRRDVVTLLALGACQRDARTNVGALACHLVHLLWFVAIPTFRRPL